MPKKLTRSQLLQFEEDGYICPISALSALQVAACMDQLRPMLPAMLGDPAENKRMQFKVHLLYPWLDALVREPAILDAVEDLIGPDILVWNSGYLVKKPHDPSFVSWHQDSTYWGLEPPDVASVWLALADSTPTNGCVRVIPGTHKGGQYAHRDTNAQNNMLSRGQEIAVEIDAAKAVDLSLRAGEMSLHHVRVVHGSQPNTSEQYRIGFIINYIPHHVRQKGARDSAMLVRGEDRFGNFDLEKRPSKDNDPASLEAYAVTTRRQLGNIMR